MRSIITLLAAIMLLAGCSNEVEPLSSKTEAIPSYKHNPDHEVIVDIWKNEILVGTTSYEITEKTKVTNSQNEKLTIEDLQPGDLVKLETIGIIMDSYPGQTEATEVVLQTDKQSWSISNSIRHFIENQKNGSIIDIRLQEVTKDTITIGFNDFNLGSDKIYEAEINRETNDFNVIEVPNEKILERERSYYAAKKVGSNGSVAGHITEIYENGFRVNMTDYSLLESSILRNDTAKELSKKDLKIGNFVRIDYSNHKGEGTIQVADINTLTLLKHDEEPGVQQWIQSVMEGPLYKDPVIMEYNTGIDGESYTIQVADLQDDTWDTFKITYDFKTKKESVERIVHVPQKRDVSPYEGITKYEIIQAIGEDTLDISWAKYVITPETVMETVNGEKITLKELKIGSLVQLEHEPTQKFAGSEVGIATKVVLRNDDLYKDISNSIRYFLTHQQVGAIHSTFISGINDYGIILRFTDEQGKSYKARIDRETNEFKVVEAVKEDL